MEGALRSNLYELFQKFQCWADNEEYIIPMFRKKSQSDEFAEKIVREIECVMEKEKFRLPKGVLIPTIYKIYISAEDSREWYGIKRDGLCHKLNNYIENRLRMLSIETLSKTFVQLQTAQDVKQGEVEVTHQWEESSSPIEIRFNKSSQAVNEYNCGDVSENTIAPAALRQAAFEYADTDYETVVCSDSERLFSLEIFYKGVHQCLIPIYQPHLTLGRGAPSVPVDIPLSGDMEISRRHAVLQMESDNLFRLLVIGRNTVTIGENTLSEGQATMCAFGETIEIGSYTLKMQM